MPDIRSEDREVQQYRTPPYSKEAEDGVLGALLIDNNILIIAEIFEIIVM